MLAVSQKTLKKFPKRQKSFQNLRIFAKFLTLGLFQAEFKSVTLPSKATWPVFRLEITFRSILKTEIWSIQG